MPGFAPKPTGNGGTAPDSSDAGRNHKWEKGIGVGDLSLVLLAHNLKTHNKVALKLIPTPIEDTESTCTKIRACQKLNHKNVVHAHDTWPGQLNFSQLKTLAEFFPKLPPNFGLPEPVQEDQKISVVYVEMEACSENLRLYLKLTDDKLARRFEIFKEISTALQFIHSQGITHGNLKPENILIHRYVAQGQRTSCIKITDPGHPVGQGSTLGSSYVAPEKNSSQLVDIFSLGVLLFEFMYLPCNQNGLADEEFKAGVLKSIQMVTLSRKFPANLTTDQFLSQLIVDMTDKDTKRRPTVSKILETFDTTLRRNLRSWARYSKQLEDAMEKGDVIEFNHTPLCHWGIYYGEGQVLHFHPVTPEEKGVTNFEQFVPAKISVSTLKEVAGVCLIRMNNRPDIRFKPRAEKETMEILKALLEHPADSFVYCKAYFNAEHFVTFLKFDGMAHSLQVMNNTKVFGQIKMLHKKNPLDVDYFNQLAYDQWSENSKKGKIDCHLVEKGIVKWGELKK